MRLRRKSRIEDQEISWSDCNERSPGLWQYGQSQAQPWQKTVAASWSGQSQVERRVSPPTFRSVALLFNEALPLVIFALLAAIEG